MLSFQQRAHLFAQLAALSGAGIASAHAWGMVRINRRIDAQLVQVKRELMRGATMAHAGQRAGVLTPLDSALLGAAEHCGDPAPVLKQLAAHYTQQDRQLRQIRARMIAPAWLALMGLLIPPLPRLFSGALTAAAYFGHVLTLGGGVVACIVLGRTLLRRMEHSRSPSQRRVWYRFLYAMPVVGHLHRRRCLAQFWRALAMLQEAGVPMLEAFPVACAVIDQTVMQQALSPADAALRRGQSFAQAMRACPALAGAHELHGLILSGESAGRLPEHLHRIAHAEDLALADAQRVWADWLPRIAYAWVALWVVAQLLAGAGIKPPPVG